MHGEARLTARADLLAEIVGSAAVSIGQADAKRSATLVVDGTTSVTSSDAIDIHSEKEIVLRCGDSFIRISGGEIEIGACKVTARGKDARLLLDDGEAKLKTKTKFQAVSEDQIVLVSSGASVGLGKQAKIDGIQVLLNSPEQATDKIQVEEPVLTKVELVDQDGRPIPHQRFRVTFDDGSEYTAFVDHEGRAEVDLGSSGKIEFPDLAEVSPG